MKNKTIRQVKLCGKYQRRQNHWNGGRDYPWLSISGLWLEHAGFSIGDRLTIVVNNNRLVITNEHDHDHQRD